MQHIYYSQSSLKFTTILNGTDYNITKLNKKAKLIFNYLII